MNALIPAAVPELRLPREHIDPDAIAVCTRLQKAGYVAYLVGGCVRDILVGRQPKDFDIGTDATPAQVRKLFRNSRIIGRRFKLAHVFFGPKIFEVATFRGGEQVHANDEDAPESVRNDSEDDHLIVRANNFGTPEQDAYSRDFTINALFYDPVAEHVIDHVGGMSDIEARLVRTVGEPVRRFQEDPVRILRGVKFAARMGIAVETDTWEGMCAVVEDIRRCSVPRVTEELYRLGESKTVEPAFRLLHSCGALQVMLPKIAAFIEENGEDYYQVLRMIDDLGRAHGPLPRPFVLSLLYYPLAWAHVQGLNLEPGPRWGEAIEDWFRPIGVGMNIPVRHRACLRTMMTFMGRFYQPEPTGKKRRRRRGPGARELASLPQALTLLRMHNRLHGDAEEIYEHWRDVAIRNDLTWIPMAMKDTAWGKEHAKPPRRRGRRRNRQ